MTSGLPVPIPWNVNQRFELYHGTDLATAKSLQSGATRINLRRCQRLTDFGRGFYTTTNLHQAKNWANQRQGRLFAGGRTAPRAAVAVFEIAWNDLRPLNSVAFVVVGAAGSSYWDLITTCRQGKIADPITDYDTAFGPVSLWPQTLTLSNCDQISFHSDRALAALGTPVRVLDAGSNLLFVVT